MWTGDNNPTDQHMLLGFRLINSMGLSGESFVGMDVGGFSGNPTPELMVRWMSLGVFTPMFRNHTAKDNTSHEPWTWGENNEKLMRNFIDLRYELLPYLYSSFYESHENGMPVNRTLAINYTYDSKIYQPAFQNEFLFGKNILVAPATSTQQMIKVYFPGGKWFRWSSGEAYTGDSASVVNSPLDDLPVFVKAGAIIPMQNVIQSTADKGDGILRINIWNGGNGSSFTYYEDDGSTYQYENGDYYKRLISFDPSSNQIILEKPEGKYATKYSKIELVLHGFDNAAAIKVNNKSMNMKENQQATIVTATFDNEAGKMVIAY